MSKWKHKARDIQVQVLDEGEEYVKFEVLRYDTSPHSRVHVGTVDVLHPRQFKILFELCEDAT